MIDKNTREIKKKLLYHSNPKHITCVSPCYNLPLSSRGDDIKYLSFYIHDYHKHGISFSINGRRGAPHAECFMERRQFMKMIDKLSEFKRKDDNE